MIIRPQQSYVNKNVIIDFQTINGTFRSLMNKVQCKNNNTVWFVLGDIHIPFQDESVLKKVFRYAKLIKAEGYNVYCMINGDLLNCDGWSTYPSYRENMEKYTVEEEIIRTKEFVENRLNKFFDEIIIHGGNHENRARYKGKDMAEDIFYWCENNEHIHFCDTTASMLIVDNAINHYRKFWWVSHQSKYSKIAASTTKALYNGVTPKANIIHGHTHIPSCINSQDMNHVLIQAGCLCDTNALMYKVKNPMTSAHAMGHAFVVIHPTGNYEFFHEYKFTDLDMKINMLGLCNDLDEQIKILSKYKEKYDKIQKMITPIITHTSISNNDGDNKYKEHIHYHETDLNKNDIKEIYFADGNYKTIGEAYGVSKNVVYNIKSGRSYKYITKELNNDE